MDRGAWGRASSWSGEGSARHLVWYRFGIGRRPSFVAVLVSDIITRLDRALVTDVHTAAVVEMEGQ